MRTLIFAACALWAVGPAAMAAPFTPAGDSAVVEQLPLRATDPAVRRLESMRQQLRARPDDAALRIDLARRYFDLSMAQGDPRYVGYAQGALTPLEASAASNASYWLTRGMLEQYNHQFDAALASLAQALKLDPQSAEAMSWRAAIFMVMARYPDALDECERMALLTLPLFTAGCRSYAQATNGALARAYRNLSAALAAQPDAPSGLVLWTQTRLAEMAQRLLPPAAAERHFKAALQLGITDQFLLAAYADFLLKQQRPAEVITLLADWERSDILLLRLALAGQAAKDPRTAGWTTQLRERFAAASARTERLHEQEAARFMLELEQRPDEALKIAAANYTTQKEPRDAEVLMRAALAARQPQAAAPAIAWLRDSRYEDAQLAQLAAQLAALPGGRAP